MLKVLNKVKELVHRDAPEWLEVMLNLSNFFDWKEVDREIMKNYRGYHTGMGRPPFLPHIMIKGTLLMVGLEIDCIEAFCGVLRQSEKHRRLIGCQSAPFAEVPDVLSSCDFYKLSDNVAQLAPPRPPKRKPQGPPAAATFRLFFRRLAEGPVACNMPRGKSGKRALHKSTDNPDQGDKVVIQKVKEVMGNFHKAPKKDFFFLCQLLLDKLGINISRRMGLLPKDLDVALDGSVKFSYANPHGIGGESRKFEYPLKREDIPEKYVAALEDVGLLDKPDEDEEEGDEDGDEGRKRVKHGPREKKAVWVGRYSDPTADWGHSNTRNLVFGHRLQGLSVYLQDIRKDLPLALSYGPASTPDALMGVELIGRFQQYLNYTGSDMKLREVAADKIYDASGVYQLLHHIGAHAIIPLSDAQKKAKVKQRVEEIEAERRRELLAQGVELPEKLEFTRNCGGGYTCPAGLEMRLFQRNVEREEVVWMCPAMRCVRDSPTKTHWEVKPELCPLNVPCDFKSRKMGPLKRESTFETLRDNTVVPRGSPEWKKKANRRTSIERLWSYLVDKVGEAFSRRGEVMFMKYLAAAILKHWKVIFEVKGG